MFTDVLAVKSFTIIIIQSKVRYSFAIYRAKMYFSVENRGPTHSLLGAAEDLGAALCCLTSAAVSQPGLHTVDGFAPPAEVAGTRFGEEAGQVSGPSVAALANVTEVLRGGQCRWERNDGLPQRVFFCLC